jgi:spore coat protein CotH
MERIVANHPGQFRIFALIPVIFAVGCDAATSDSAGPGGASGGPAGGSGGTSGTGECGVVDSTLAERDAAELFALPTVPTFDVWLPPERWTELQRNARDEEYVEAMACFEGRGLGRVGLRFKGAEGSLYSCFDDAGNNTCRKLPLKIKFDEYAADQRFYGLKRLNFHANRYDDTYLRERLAFDLYRSMGIVAPRSAWATVRVNGEVYGLFGMVEQVDGRFTADRWPERGDENLFKEVWPVHADAGTALEHLETNEETGDVGAFVAFARAMDEAPESALRETLGQFVDLEYWARYMAVDDAVAAYDGITTFYTSTDGAWSGNHNFYLYQASSTRFVLIPWDMEATFVRNSGFGAVPRWTTIPADCSATYPVWGGKNSALAPGCDRVFRALAQDLEFYGKAGRELLDGPFVEQSMIEAIDAHAARIREHVARDPNGPGNARWQGALGFLKQEIPGLRARFERLLSGQVSTPAEVQVTGATDFENLDEFSLSDGPSLGYNPSSTAAVSINTDSPLVGERDLLLSFAYSDEAEPWQQWMSYRIPVAGGSFDAEALSGIRIWVRADRARVLRFDLDSPASSRAIDGIRSGWDVPVSEAPTLMELSFQDAAIPAWAASSGSSDELQQVLRTLTALVFFPNCAGRDLNTGQLGQGVRDNGFVAIDQIEFF